MSYQNYPSEVIDVEYTEVLPAWRDTGAGLLFRRSGATVSKVMAEGMVLQVHDQCLAMLAKAGLEHTAALSMAETVISSQYQQSAADCREIVSAYAQSVIGKIRRWRNG